MVEEALGLALDWGVTGGWLGLTFEIIVGAAILWWRLAREQWRAAAVTTRERTIAVASAAATAG